MGQYRKKPVVINAIQWNPDTMLVKDILDSFGGLKGMNGIRIGKVRSELIIHTLEGEMTARAGDYIIKGIKGEVYSCKPDIFEMTYETV